MQINIMWSLAQQRVAHAPAYKSNIKALLAKSISQHDQAWRSQLASCIHHHSPYTHSTKPLLTWVL